MNTLPTHDAALASKAQALLRASETLDAVETARLAAARALALDALQAPLWQRLAASFTTAMEPRWLAVPAALLLGFALLPLLRPASDAAGLAVNHQALPALTPALDIAVAEQLDYAASFGAVEEASPAFYEDLEFYAWLNDGARHEPDA